MDSNFSSNPQKKGSGHSQPTRNSRLILHNDDVNSFEFVMEALEEVCEHSQTQAEQCAVIAHYKGSCEVKIGELSEITEQRHALIARGLKATID